MALFDSTNKALQLLVGARNDKRRLDQEKEQAGTQNLLNGLNTVAGIAKTGIDIYDKMALAPKREEAAAAAQFGRDKELETIKAANQKDLQQDRINYETWAKQFDAKSAAALNQAGIDNDVWKTLYTTSASAEEKDRERTFTMLLTQKGIDAEMARLIAAQAFQKSEREAGQEFAKEFAKVESGIRKDEAGFSAELNDRIAAKAHGYAVELSNLGRDNAITVATEQAKLDTARDIALQAARTRDQKDVIESEYALRSKELAQKFGYDEKLLSSGQAHDKEMADVQNKLGIQRDQAGYDAQARRDQIIHGFEMAGKQYDRETQEYIANVQTKSEEKLLKARSDFAIAEELYKAGLAEKSDVAAFERQLQLVQKNHDNAMFQLEKEFGYKSALEDQASGNTIKELYVKGGIDEKTTKSENENRLSVARINAASSLSDTKERASANTQDSYRMTHGTIGLAQGYATEVASSMLSSSGKSPSTMEINTKAAEILESDADQFDSMGYSDLAKNARRAAELLASGKTGTPQPTTAGIGKVNLGVMGGNSTSSSALAKAVLPPDGYVSWADYYDKKNLRTGKIPQNLPPNMR